MKNKKGFTLVELMIVMVVIGILLSLLLPGIFTAQQEALKLKTASNLRQIGIALYAHAKNNNGKLPTTLLELETEEYIDDMGAINTNIDGNPFTFNEADANLYGLNASDALATDDSTAEGGTKATGYILSADGSVNSSS